MTKEIQPYETITKEEFSDLLLQHSQYLSNPNTGKKLILDRVKIKFNLGDSLEGPDLSKAVFSHCTFHNIRFLHCKLRTTTFKYCDLHGSTFSQGEGNSIRFISCNLSNVLFEHINLSDAEIKSISKTNGTKVQFRNLRFNPKIIQGVYLTEPIFSGVTHKINRSGNTVENSEFINPEFYNSSEIESGLYIFLDKGLKITYEKKYKLSSIELIAIDEDHLSLITTFAIEFKKNLKGKYKDRIFVSIEPTNSTILIEIYASDEQTFKQNTISTLQEIDTFIKAALVEQDGIRKRGVSNSNIYQLYSLYGCLQAIKLMNEEDISCLVDGNNLPANTLQIINNYKSLFTLAQGNAVLIAPDNSKKAKSSRPASKLKSWLASPLVIIALLITAIAVVYISSNSDKDISVKVNADKYGLEINSTSPQN